jgi:D-alanyl-D-alanine carboxypeptidase (penicillin-binding protein 5/6)
MTLLHREGVYEKRPAFRIVSRRRISDVWLGGREVTYYSTNELLNPEGAYYYENATGIKTGSNGQAGQCLVSSAEMDGALYVCVVMGSTEEARWTDSIALFEAARNR